MPSVFLFLLLGFNFRVEAAVVSPPVWPEKFHAILYQNRSDDLAIVDLYYDYTVGRNLNLIRSMHDDDAGSQGELWDVEFNNKSSFYYHPRAKTCTKMEFPVGILKPNWLENATYLGIEYTQGYHCHVWTKADGFITYWDEVSTRKPVKWIFGSGMEEYVMKWIVNETLPDSQWEIPNYCFKKWGPEREENGHNLSNLSTQRFFTP
mmetsp:Transcript_9935/g.14924  ORF Transcript_9935/g.14924 Transcript_9935/m.14924 type:complete len:206 (-) Transcript_9935:76-693(-)